MQQSDVESAGDEADRFQTSFYYFIEALAAKVQQTSEAWPADSDEAVTHPMFASFFANMPEPLSLPFSTEIDLLLAGESRLEDNTQQG